jgi:hypothetical protein
MGWLTDLLQGIPLNPTLRERVELAEQKSLMMEAENKRLQSQVEALTILNDRLTKQVAEHDAAQVRETEQKGVMYGCYYFGGDRSKLYCIKCYETLNKKYPMAAAGRLGHQCTVCGNQIPR